LTKSASGCSEDRPPFDLIVTDAFLTRFTPDDAAVVVGNWARLLNAGGTVVTTVRLRGLDQPRQGGAANEVADFVLRFRQYLMAWHAVLGVDIEELLDAAHEYALRMTSANLGEAGDVVRLLESHGLRVVHHESVEVAGELHRTGYVRLVARNVNSALGSTG
jgi:hypothetical protein